MGFWSDIGNGIEGAFGIGGGDPSNPDRDALRGLGNTGIQNYGQDRADTTATQDYFRDQMMGKNSVANETLRQGLQQGVAAQTAMAAGARPGDAPMAARTAAMNMMRMQAGLSGQQAMASLQESSEGAHQLAQMQLARQGQDLQAGLGAYGTALGAPQKTWGSMLGGAIGGFAGGVGQGVGKGI